MHLYDAPARLRPDRARALRRARRRRLRRRPVAAAGRQRRRGRSDPRPRPPLDGAGLGGQPRLADLRAHRRLDRVPDRVRLDRLDALRSRCSSRRSGSSSAAPPTRCAPAARRRASGARSTRVFAVSSILTPFALGAAVGGIASGRVPVGNAAGRPGHELAEPDVDPDRRRSPSPPPPTWPPSSSPPTRVRRGETCARARSARARSAPASSPGALALGGLVVLHADAPSLYARPRQRRRAGRR